MQGWARPCASEVRSIRARHRPGECMTEPNIHDLARQVAVLEERMNTSYERLRADMAKRDRENTRWIVGAIIAAVIVIIGAMRYLP